MGKLAANNGNSKTVVLVADDDAVTRRLLEHQLQSAGFVVLLAADGDEAVEKLTPNVNVALFDLQMPKRSGLDCLKYAQQHTPDTQVIVISQFGDIADAVEAIKCGAVEYITKPIDDFDSFIARVRHAALSQRLKEENRQLRQAMGSPLVDSAFFGASPSTKRLMDQIAKVATLDSTVLLTGESGTGKTTLAHRIHALSPRRGQPFVSVSCASIPRDLLEAELFGHVRGAFTNAVADRPGRAEMADDGTLFLDEIGDLPLELQPKLLTFLQDRTVQRIGSTQIKRIDTRIIAATNQDLDIKCREGAFREDLFFRLNVLPIEVPALRDRKDDFDQLVGFVVQRIAAKRGCPPFQIAPDAMDRLRAHTWPGNIRELENVLERATAFCVGSQVGVDDLWIRGERRQAANATPSLAGMTLEQIERRAVIETLEHCGGNKKAAAKLLDIDEKSIYNKMKRLGITPT